MSIPEISVKNLSDDQPMVDVREQDEWEAGHAIRAQHLPLGQVAQRSDELPDKDAGPVYVVCRAGGRSAQATTTLRQLGWDAVNVSEGMSGWEQAGKQIVSDSGQPPAIL